MTDNANIKTLSGYPSKDKPWLKYYSEEQIFNASNIPQGKTLWDVLEEELQTDSDFTAVEYFGFKITRAKFIDLVYRWARAFKVLEVCENEVVPIYGPNFPDMCAIACALNLIGAVSYFLKLEISNEALLQETSDSKIAVVYDTMWGNVKSVINETRFEKVIFITESDYMLFGLKAAVSIKKLISGRKKINKTDKYIYAEDALKLSEKCDVKNLKAVFKKIELLLLLLQAEHLPALL